MKEKAVVSTNDEIMNRYLQLRKIAISYWDYFGFFLGNTIFLPLLQRSRIKSPLIQILCSIYVSYEFSKFSLKYFLKFFNNHEYNIYRDFCLKYKMYDTMLI